MALEGDMQIPNNLLFSLICRAGGAAGPLMGSQTPSRSAASELICLEAKPFDGTIVFNKTMEVDTLLDTELMHKCKRKER